MKLSPSSRLAVWLVGWGTKGALYEKLIHDFGPDRKSWKQFFPAPLAFCFFFFGLFISLQFFFFF